MTSLAFASEPEPTPPVRRAPGKWVSAILVPKASRRELGLVLGLSALLHGGVAAATLGAKDAAGPPRPLSRVQIAVQRAPRPLPPPPRQEPPPPRQEPPPEVKPRLAKARAPEPRPEPARPLLAEPLPELPQDTGSSAAAAPDGELFAGAGGLGTAQPAPPPPPGAPKPAPPAPVVQAHEGANYLKNPRPAYPGIARRQGWEGTTLLRVLVQGSGRAGAIQVQRSSGRTALDDAAVEAVKRWTFVPATQGGNPVTGWVTVPIVFRLQ